MSTRRATTNHREILDWASRHNLTPVEVVLAEHDHEPPELAFAAPGEIRGQLRPLAWDQFLALFSLLDLALVYDAHSADDPGTNSYEIVHNRPKATTGRPLAQA